MPENTSISDWRLGYSCSAMTHHRPVAPGPVPAQGNNHRAGGACTSCPTGYSTGADRGYTIRAGAGRAAAWYGDPGVTVAAHGARNQNTSAWGALSE